jgi:hypothetical protein
MCRLGGVPRRHTSVLRLSAALDACLSPRRNNGQHTGCSPHTDRADRRPAVGTRGRGDERSHANARRASNGGAGAAGDHDDAVPDQRRRRVEPHRVCAGTDRRLAGVARGTAARLRSGSARGHLPKPDADHVRELRARAPQRTVAADAAAGGHGRGGEPGPVARTAAALSRRVRLPGVRTPGGAARARPLHARTGASANRPRVPVHRLAVSELPLRSPVHADELCDHAAGARRRPVGVQVNRRRVEPRRGRADRAGNRATRPFANVGSRVRGPESGDAGAGCGRCPQRPAAAAGACGSAFADRGTRG